MFFAEAIDKHANAILLLDEPGLSLHGLKQREFRTTLSRLSDKNQVLYITHSPFLVGPDELDLVRVVEMVDRRAGTKVHTTVTATDPASFLPLQEALGYLRRLLAPESIRSQGGSQRVGIRPHQHRVVVGRLSVAVRQNQELVPRL